MVGVNQHSTYIKWWRLLWQVDMFIPLSEQNIDVEHYSLFKSNGSTRLSGGEKGEGGAEHAGL